MVEIKGERLLYLGTGLWIITTLGAAYYLGLANSIVNVFYWILGGMEFVEFIVWIVSGGDLGLYLDSPMTEEKLQILMGLGAVLSISTLSSGIYSLGDEKLGGRRSILLPFAFVGWPLVGLATAAATFRLLSDRDESK